MNTLFYKTISIKTQVWNFEEIEGHAKNNPRLVFEN